MTEINQALLTTAEKYTQGVDVENMSELLEQESRRYSTRLVEAEEARMR